MFEYGMLQLPQASVAAKIELDSYVNDQLTGRKAKPEAVADMAEAVIIIGKGGFRYKSKTCIGGDKLGTKVLVVLWDPCAPTIWKNQEERQEVRTRPGSVGGRSALAAKDHQTCVWRLIL
ncbi:MAG: hypothetical protein GY696_27610 [Gammaproteobacteria bacterium]|nr:hypothetical protein [Gammaproteobacteria bacterium]